MAHRPEAATLSEGHRKAAHRVVIPARWTASDRLDDEPHRLRRSFLPASWNDNPHGFGSAHLGISLLRRQAVRSSQLYGYASFTVIRSCQLRIALELTYAPVRRPSERLVDKTMARPKARCAGRPELHRSDGDENRGARASARCEHPERSAGRANVTSEARNVSGFAPCGCFDGAPVKTAVLRLRVVLCAVPQNYGIAPEKSRPSMGGWAISAKSGDFVSLKIMIY